MRRLWQLASGWRWLFNLVASFGGRCAARVQRVASALATVIPSSWARKRKRQHRAQRALRQEFLEQRHLMAAAITQVTPNSSLLTGGTAVSIMGTGFTGVTAVSFGGTNATSFTVNSANSITAYAPGHTAGVVDIQVLSTMGNSPIDPAHDQFTYSATGGGMNPPAASPPTLTGMNVHTGGVGGGTQVVITGTNFTNVSAVTFGGTPATSFTVNSPTQITATSPSRGMPGTVDVLVVTSAGSTAINASVDFFTYSMSGPTVTAVSPNSGTSSGGTQVVITGTNFTSVSSVSFGGTNATSYTVNSPTQITATAPAHTSGTFDIVVSTMYGGSSTVTAGDKFTYLAPVLPPMVSGITNNSGLVGGGTSVTISGTNFTNVTGVSFGGVAATSFVVNSATSITAVAPAHAAGVCDIVVTNTAGSSGVTNQDQFTYIGPPTVSSLSATSGTTAGGQTLTITGTNFYSVSSVTFGGVSAASFMVLSPTSIMVTTPSRIAGVCDVKIQALGGLSSVVAADQFTFVTPAPTVTGVSPPTGTTAGGSSITITGTNFTGATSVLIGGVAATSFVVNSATSITAVTPASTVATGGAVDITVQTPGGVSAVSTSDRFTYVVPNPVVSGLSASSGTTDGGPTITITGSNFLNVTAVSFGGTPATSYTVVSATTITAIVPAHGMGMVDVQVTTASGTSSVSTSDQYSYYVPPPAITGLSVHQGWTTGGTTVTITGTRLSGASAVRFGNVAATSFTVVNDTTITATSPMASVGTVDVTVQTMGGTSSVTMADQFVYQVPVPAVTGLSITSGSADGGVTVTLTGVNFSGAMSVKFGDTAATSFTVVNDTTITAVAPAHAAGIVDVTVSTMQATSTLSAADQFTYAWSAPIVSSLSKTSGTVDGGDSFTITGQNFANVTAVKFGTVNAASVMVLSSTQILVTAPVHSAGVCDVTVQTATGTSAISTSDQYTFVVPAPSVTSVSVAGQTPGAIAEGTTEGGTLVTVVGTHLEDVTQVWFGDAAALAFAVNADGTITAYAPIHVPGAIDVTIVTTHGTSPTSSADQFRFVVPPPVVTGVSVSAGPEAGGTVVTLTGTGFLGATKVKFGAVEATTFVIDSPTSITVTAPAGSGAVPISVETPAGVSTTGSGDVFTYQANTGGGTGSGNQGGSGNTGSGSTGTGGTGGSGTGGTGTGASGTGTSGTGTGTGGTGTGGTGSTGTGGTGTGGGGSTGGSSTGSGSSGSLVFHGGLHGTVGAAGDEGEDQGWIGSVGPLVDVTRFSSHFAGPPALPGSAMYLVAMPHVTTTYPANGVTHVEGHETQTFTGGDVTHEAGVTKTVTWSVTVKVDIDRTYKTLFQSFSVQMPNGMPSPGGTMIVGHSEERHDSYHYDITWKAEYTRDGDSAYRFTDDRIGDRTWSTDAYSETISSTSTSKSSSTNKDDSTWRTKHTTTEEPNYLWIAKGGGHLLSHASSTNTSTSSDDDGRDWFEETLTDEDAAGNKYEHKLEGEHKHQDNSTETHHYGGGSISSAASWHDQWKAKVDDEEDADATVSRPGRLSGGHDKQKNEFHGEEKLFTDSSLSTTGAAETQSYSALLTGKDNFDWTDKGVSSANADDDIDRGRSGKDTWTYTHTTSSASGDGPATAAVDDSATVDHHVDWHNSDDIAHDDGQQQGTGDYSHTSDDKSTVGKDDAEHRSSSHMDWTAGVSNGWSKASDKSWGEDDWTEDEVDDHRANSHDDANDDVSREDDETDDFDGKDSYVHFSDSYSETKNDVVIVNKGSHKNVDNHRVHEIDVDKGWQNIDSPGSGGQNSGGGSSPGGGQLASGSNTNSSGGNGSGGGGSGSGDETPSLHQHDDFDWSDDVTRTNKVTDTGTWSEGADGKITSEDDVIKHEDVKEKFKNGDKESYRRVTRGAFGAITTVVITGVWSDEGTEDTDKDDDDDVKRGADGGSYDDNFGKGDDEQDTAFMAETIVTTVKGGIAENVYMDSTDTITFKDKVKTTFKDTDKGKDDNGNEADDDHKNWDVDDKAEFDDTYDATETTTYADKSGTRVVKTHFTTKDEGETDTNHDDTDHRHHTRTTGGDEDPYTDGQTVHDHRTGSGTVKITVTKNKGQDEFKTTQLWTLKEFDLQIGGGADDSGEKDQTTQGEKGDETGGSKVTSHLVEKGNYQGSFLSKTVNPETGVTTLVFGDWDEDADIDDNLEVDGTDKNKDVQNTIVKDDRTGHVKDVATVNAENKGSNITIVSIGGSGVGDLLDKMSKLDSPVVAPKPPENPTTQTDAQKAAYQAEVDRANKLDKMWNDIKNEANNLPRTPPAPGKDKGVSFVIVKKVHGEGKNNATDTAEANGEKHLDNNVNTASSNGTDTLRGGGNSETDDVYLSLVSKVDATTGLTWTWTTIGSDDQEVTETDKDDASGNSSSSSAPGVVSGGMSKDEANVDLDPSGSNHVRRWWTVDGTMSIPQTKEDGTQVTGTLEVHASGDGKADASGGGTIHLTSKDKVTATTETIPNPSGTGMTPRSKSTGEDGGGIKDQIKSQVTASANGKSTTTFTDAINGFTVTETITQGAGETDTEELNNDDKGEETTSSDAQAPVDSDVKHDDKDEVTAKGNATLTIVRRVVGTIPAKTQPGGLGPNGQLPPVVVSEEKDIDDTQTLTLTFKGKGEAKEEDKGEVDKHPTSQGATEDDKTHSEFSNDVHKHLHRKTITTTKHADGSKTRVVKEHDDDDNRHKGDKHDHRDASASGDLPGENVHTDDDKPEESDTDVVTDTTTTQDNPADGPTSPPAPSAGPSNPNLGGSSSGSTTNNAGNNTQGGGGSTNAPTPGPITVLVNTTTTTHYTMGASGGEKVTVDQNGSKTIETYSIAGDLLTYTDPDNNTTTWTYDGDHHALTETNSLNKTRSFAYDADGNLIKRIDRDGRETDWTYDSQGHKTSEKWVDRTDLLHPVTLREYDWTYDADGRLTSASSPDATYTYTYDADGRVSTVSIAETGAPLVVFAVTYDAHGNRSSFTATVGGTGDFTNHYSYDTLDRLVSLTQSGVTAGNGVAEKRVDFAYTDDGRYSHIDRFADLAGTQAVASTNYSYDAQGRLTSLANHQGSLDLGSYAYSYNSDGHIASIDYTSYLTAASAAHGYSYDATGQVVGETHTDQQNHAYVYDANGNRTSVTNGTATAAWTIGANNQVLSDGVSNYTYDGEGNLSRKTSIATGEYTTYTWGADKELLKVESHTATGAVTMRVTYGYDAELEMVLRTVDLDGDGTAAASTSWFVYDVAAPTTATRVGQSGEPSGVNQGVRQIVMRLDQAGATTSVVVSHRYLWAADVDHLLVDEKVTTVGTAGVNRWTFGDHLGTIADIATYDAATGVTAVIDHRTFDAFGSLASETNSLEFDFAYTGRFFDVATGLQYNWHRWYSPHLGKWVSQDPMEFGAHDPNIGRYAGNDVIEKSDPTGLDESSPPIGGEGLTWDVQPGQTVELWLVNVGIPHQLLQFDPGFSIPVDPNKPFDPSQLGIGGTNPGTVNLAIKDRVMMHAMLRTSGQYRTYDSSGNVVARRNVYIDQQVYFATNSSNKDVVAVELANRFELIQLSRMLGTRETELLKKLRDAPGLAGSPALNITWTRLQKDDRLQETNHLMGEFPKAIKPILPPQLTSNLTDGEFAPISSLSFELLQDNPDFSPLGLPRITFGQDPGRPASTPQWFHPPAKLPIDNWPFPQLRVSP